MDAEFFQNGRWTLTKLPDDRYQLEDFSLAGDGDQTIVQVLCSNLKPDDLLSLRKALDTALGNHDCQKCSASHSKDGPHHPMFEKWLRSLADYDNLLKRNKQEQLQSQFEISRRILTDILLLMDNIRAVVSGKLDGTPLSPEEIRIISSSLDSMLQKNEVMPLFPGMQATTLYNPEHHQAVEMAEGDVAETLVVPLMQGYLWKDKVLRTAQVRIVQPRKPQVPQPPAA